MRCAALGLPGWQADCQRGLAVPSPCTFYRSGAASLSLMIPPALLPPRPLPHAAVVLAVNKCENTAKADLQAAEFWGTGLEPIAVSAISGSGE